MNGVIDQIKQKLDIAEVIGGYLKLTKAGRNYKARCPFHNERTPSFMVSVERQIWKCFGCGLGGDIFAFVKQIEGVEFGDALRILAHKAGVILKKQDPQLQTQKKRLYEICELATKFFEVQLAKSTGGRKVQQYLKERGLKSEVIKTWRLGWAPDEWRALSDFLQQRGYKEEEIFNAGLTVRREEKSEIRNPKSETNPKFQPPNYYDRFRSRIMFPIFDIQGQVVGFAGRIFGQKEKDENVGKYINTPQTSLYDKSRILYGLNFARMELRQKNACILVEGNLDVIASHQAGIKNTVASSGTALTEEHLKIISRYTDNLLFAFDADLAGETATRRSIDLALARDFEIKIIMLKDKDPADLIKKNSAGWPKAIAQAQSVMDFYFITTFAKFNNQTPAGKKEIKKNLLPVIKTIGSKTEQFEWLRELARRLRLNEKDLVFDMEKIKIADQQTQRSDVVAAAPVSEVKSRADGLEERFLGLCLNHPQHLPGEAAISENDFQNQQLAQIFGQLKNSISAKKEADLMNHLQKSLAPELKLQLEYLSLKVQLLPADELQVIAEIEVCARELKVIKIKQQLTVLSFEIEEAQKEKEAAKIKKLLEKFNQLSGELIELTRR